MPIQTLTGPCTFEDHQLSFPFPLCLPVSLFPNGMRLDGSELASWIGTGGRGVGVAGGVHALPCVVLGEEVEHLEGGVGHGDWALENGRI